MSFVFKKPEESPGFLLWQLTNQWQRLQRKALKTLGLTHAQFVVLAALLWLDQNTDTQTTQNYVAEFTGIDKMSMSDLTKTLLNKKLLRRAPHQQDGRAYNLMLTSKGKDLVLKALPIVEGVDISFFNKKNLPLIQLVKTLNLPD